MGFLDINLRSLIALIFCILGILILAIGAWGYSILPSNCPQNRLRNYLSGMIVCGAAMVTIFVGYFICANSCHPYDKNTESVSTFIYVVGAALFGVISILQGLAINELGDSSNSVCLSDSSSSTFVNVLKYTIIIPIAGVLACGTMVYLYLKSDRDAARSNKKATEDSTNTDITDKKYAGAVVNVKQTAAAEQAKIAQERENSLKLQLDKKSEELARVKKELSVSKTNSPQNSSQNSSRNSVQSDGSDSPRAMSDYAVDDEELNRKYSALNDADDDSV